MCVVLVSVRYVYILHISVCGLVCVHEVYVCGLCGCMCTCDVGGLLLHVCVFVCKRERVCVWFGVCGISICNVV